MLAHYTSPERIVLNVTNSERADTSPELFLSNLPCYLSSAPMLTAINNSIFSNTGIFFPKAVTTNKYTM